jgi:hypothetical protein
VGDLLRGWGTPSACPFKWLYTRGLGSAGDLERALDAAVLADSVAVGLLADCPRRPGVGDRERFRGERPWPAWPPGERVPVSAPPFSMPLSGRPPELTLDAEERRVRGGDLEVQKKRHELVSSPCEPKLQQM